MFGPHRQVDELEQHQTRRGGVSRGRLLWSLYSRYRPTQSNTTSSSSVSSNNSDYTLPNSIRRQYDRETQLTPTVQVVRPSPEVEFSRISNDASSHTPTGAASLLSLRASQQTSGGSAEDNHSVSTSALQTLSAKRDGSYRSLYTGSRPSSIAAPVSTVSTGKEDVKESQAIPFQNNALEIAAQDDKNECTFLAGNCHQHPTSILPLLVGQMQPVTSFSSTDHWPQSKQLEIPKSSLTSKSIRQEHELIQKFNHTARQRIHQTDANVLSEFCHVHLCHIIRQLLDEVDVPDTQGWDQVVLSLAINAAQRVRPNVREGDNKDLRGYVRIKRIPGGSPSDSQYVTGIVFTKNLAHRKMPRHLESPHIMLLAFPLEYTPPTKYASFDEELKVQQEFTEKLLQRIVGVAPPDVVLVEKTIPRRVLEGLINHKITVVYGVKRSVLRAVARCTGAEIITSIDKFSDYPRTGQCQTMVVQTYEHPSLSEYRKSFIYLDGCDESLGGTIVLRGESFDKLGDIKQVVDLVVCLTYSMHLESCLLANQYTLGVSGQYDQAWTDTSARNDTLALQALNEYNIVLSSSPCVRIPPPDVLTCMRENELAIAAIAERFNRLTSSVVTDNNGRTRDPSVNPGGVSFLVSRQQSAAGSRRMRQQYESELALHESFIREGEAFLDSNPHAVSLWDYQNIVVAYLVTCRKHDYMLCAGPQYHSIEFYGATDVTLGQYLEWMCFDLRYDCPNKNRLCMHPMYEHKLTYIHNDGKLEVTTDEYPCPLERMSEVILMWGQCKKCQRQTPTTIMSDETWRYSFGKYLETTFYGDQLKPRAQVCDHDMQRDYVRFFALRNMAVRFEYTQFPIWSISVPTAPLYFNVEVSIKLKDAEAKDLRTKMDAYYGSLINRLDAFPLELVYPDKVESCKSTLQALQTRAGTEQVYFQQTLEQTIRNTHPADTLVIVVVYEALQNKVVEWNLQFSELAQSFIQLETAHNRVSNTGSSSTTKRVDSTDMLKSTNVQDEANMDKQGGYPIDSFATDLDNTQLPADSLTQCNMPRLDNSPSETSAVEMDEWRRRRPRMHRKLSILAMKKEREKVRRLAAETADSRARQNKSHQPTVRSPPRQPIKGGHHGSATSSVLKNLSGAFLDVISKKHGTSGYTSTRLIGSIANNIADDRMQVPRQTVFPELRRRGIKSSKTNKYEAGFGSKSTKPLLDSLDTGNTAAPPRTSPSRIPVPNRIVQQEQSVGPERPLSSYGKPPPVATGSSNIPRAPNIRSRAVSPDKGEQQQQQGKNTNVFLRLAKRLNSAKGDKDGGSDGGSTIMGTMPRKMNLLLPAAAQYISQHPRRPAMSQVQVFYTNKPSNSDDNQRRHSYQSNMGVDDTVDDRQLVRRHRSATVHHRDRSPVDSHVEKEEEEEGSLASKAAGIIPNITRRLGLAGFSGFRHSSKETSNSRPSISSHRSRGNRSSYTEDDQLLTVSDNEIRSKASGNGDGQMVVQNINRRSVDLSNRADDIIINAATPTSSTHMDMFLSSPMNTVHPSSLLTSSSPSRLTYNFTQEGEEDDDDDDDMLLSSPQHPRLILPRDSFSDVEDDDNDHEQPHLHFGHSDTGSDGDDSVINQGSNRVSEQDAKNAAAYLRSVMAATNTQVTTNDAGLELMTGATEQPSTASTSTSAFTGLQLLNNNRSVSVESGMDTLEKRDSPVPNVSQQQENMSTLWKTIFNMVMAPGSSQLFQLGLDLRYPLSPTEHVISGSPVIVRESEPSSVIAFTLMAGEYRQKLHSIFEEARQDYFASADPDSKSANHSTASPDDGSSQSPPDKMTADTNKSPPRVDKNETTEDGRSEEDIVLERVMLRAPDYHLGFQFTAGRTKFVCKVYYAAQFEALRRCNGCEDSYIESISRCMEYQAQGGKSGSAFLRTRDERFIIKQVSRAESEAFLKFAPYYFEHMYSTYRNVLLTVLAKIFGFCRVTYRNADTGQSTKMNVVIMENLFYQRKCTRVFDLKGSLRNRMVEETQNEDSGTAVWQDENLIKLIRETPICIRQPTKHHLHAAIWNDTLFLSKMNVMDYSLLVGFDHVKQELVVGIVDFIRTFTWDKQLESWVKEAGILGGGGKGPTIVSPKQYKARFREAMDKYFLMVPGKFF